MTGPDYRSRASALGRPTGPPSPGQVLAGRFEINRPLKSGKTAETFLGTDQTDGKPVVIKTVPAAALTTGARMRQEHEAAVLRELRSPWFTPLLHVGLEEHRLCFVSPYVSGVSLAERLARAPLSLADTLAIAQCLMKALQEAHDHGVLHRNVRPTNAILTDGVPLQLVLIDFGLARSAHMDGAVADHSLSTVRYLSPEQAGLLDRGIDERSDLYSAGVLLFECLAGRPPFLGATLNEVLRQQLSARPPELRSLGIAIPRALDEIVQRLLRKDPRDRYQSADAVAADVTAVANALARGVTEPDIVVGLSDRRRALTEPAFVGRNSELAALDVALAQARTGMGGVVLLEAESGAGKSRLLDEFAQRGARRGAWVFRGQGQNQAAQRPFQVLVGVADGLRATAALEPELTRAVRSGLGEHRPAVCAALPELANTLDVHSVGGLGPESFGEARSLEALVRLLTALGSRERPALVLLDDCQWADELTFKLLQRWSQRPDAEDLVERCVLLVVGFRSEEVPPDHALRGMNASAHVVLSGFTPAGIRQLAESMAGPLPDDAVQVITQLAQGSPFMAGAVLQGLVESGALIAEPGGWRTEALALQDIHSSRHAAAFLARRISLLPPDVVALLSAGAVLGKEFDLSLTAELTGQTASAAIAAVDEGRRRQLVWAQDTRCVFVHDKLRQTFLGQLPDEQRKDLHFRAALYLEGQSTRSPFDLAYHFDAAGHSSRALPYALEAAERARAQHALESAEQQYRIAEHGLAGADEATRLRVAQGLGDVYMLRGRYREAARHFEAARGLAQGKKAEARIEGLLGELAFKMGDVETALTTIERALRLSGRLVPRRFMSFTVLVLWEIFVQVLHSLLPRAFLSRRPLAEADDARLVMRLYSKLAHLYWFHRGTLPCLWAHLREMNLAERFPPTPELAQAYSEHAPVMSLVPNFRRGIAYAQKSLAIRRNLGDVWGQGQSLNFYGVILYASSRFSECISKCREAVRLLERTGDHWEVHIARFQVAASLYRLGDLRGALAEARRIHERGLELGDAQASGLSLDIWARATGGRVPAELIQTELARPQNDVQRVAQVMLAEGVRLLGAGRPAASAAILAETQEKLRRAGIRNAWVAPVLPWLATAWREAALRGTDLTPGSRRRYLRRSWKAACQALRRRRCFPNDVPHTLRELGLLSAMLGRGRRAQRYFRESLEAARRQEARYEMARTRLAQARVGLELGWPNAADDLRAARQELETLENPVMDAAAESGAAGRPATLSLADRFDSLLEVGRRITAALSREAIVTAVQEAAQRLLRGEECTVLDLKDFRSSEEPGGEVGAVGDPHRWPMVRRAVEAGRAVAAVVGGPDGATETLALAGVRSVLCAPISVWGQPAACLWVIHRQVSGLFASDEERLADFIAALAGAALENAEGFAELRRLNDSLQREMTERMQAEKQVRDQAALLDKAQDAIMVLDADHQILYWNRSAERLYGLSSAEAMGKNAATLLFRKTTPEWDTALRSVLEKGEWSGELSQVRADGKDIIVESRWTLVRDDDGQPTSRLVVNTDITDKCRLEANLLRAQRTESLGTLAGGIAHDINNVLTPIVMGIDMLKLGLGDSPFQGLLADMETSAQRGTEMVRQILSFARGGSEGQKKNLCLKQVIADIEKMVRRTLPKTITVRTNVAANLGLAWGDSTQLYQTMMNLCVNARDAMPDGGVLTMQAGNVEVDVDAARVHPDARPGPHVLLSVTDTGTGIPPDILARIFDPFFTTKEQGKGTGLGLSTVMGIVKGHGGFLSVTSELGVGTRFGIYLPIVAAAETDQAEQTARQLPNGQGEAILVVDDEPRICQLTKQMLEGHGYHVLTAANGAEALAVYARCQDNIRVVLTDMMMPVMDGLATIRGLRTIDPAVRVIATGGLMPTRNPTEAFPENVHVFLPKPYTAENLLTTLQSVLREPTAPTLACKP